MRLAGDGQRRLATSGWKGEQQAQEGVSLSAQRELRDLSRNGH